MFESRYCSQALSLGVMSTYSINTMSVHIQRQHPSLGAGQNVVKHYVVTVVCCKYFMDTLPFLARGHDCPERLSVFQPAQSLLSVF